MISSADVSRPGIRQHRILFACQSLDVGGTERHLATLLPALARHGWPITVYCFNSRGANADTVAASGVEVIGPPVSARLAHTPKVVRLALLPLAMARFAWIMARRRPAIVHFFLGEPYIAGAPIAAVFRVPVRVMSRRSLNLYLANMPGAAYIEALLHRRMTAILGNSRAIIDELVAEGCRPDQLGLIYNGIETEKLRPARGREEVRASLAIPQGAFVAVIVANLNPYKGHADLVAGLGAAKDRMPRDWVLLCAGRDDGAEAGLRAAAERFGIASNVRLLGARNDIPDLLAAADIGILCSHEEGFSNALIEKMAAGLPMVVTNVGGNPEAALDGVTGLVVPPRAPEALGAAIARLAGDPDLRRRFGASGRARVESLFTFDAMVSRYEALYRGLLAGKRPGDLPDIAIDPAASGAGS